ADGEGDGEDPLHVDAGGGEHGAVIDAGTDHHADAGAIEEPPQQNADDDGADEENDAVGGITFDDRQRQRAENDARRIELIDETAPLPEHEIGEHDRDADRDHGLAKVLALHKAKDRYLEKKSDQRRGQKSGGDGEQPGIGGVAHLPADIGAEQIE